MQRRGGYLARFKTFVLVLSLMLNAYLIYKLRSSEERSGSVTIDGVTITDGPAGAQERKTDEVSMPKPSSDGPSEHVRRVIGDTPGEIVDASTGMRRVELALEGSLARTFSQAMGRETGDLVSAIVARIFMWKLSLTSDVFKGDKIRLLYRVLPEESTVDVQAATYQSRKMQQVFEAYKYQPPDRKFPSYWDGEGREIPLRLKNPPLKDYEEITALLKDRPRHHGMDFKTPVGTPVMSPFAGTVSRVNWNRANGRCVEVKYKGKGVVAKFLHLSKFADGVKPGTKVKAGEVIAYSGNTGRSTAPHLHYQLETLSGKIIDPLEFHGTTEAVLDAEAAAEFTIIRDRLKEQLGTGA